jgi:hypothetical protein
MAKRNIQAETEKAVRRAFGGHANDAPGDRDIPAANEVEALHEFASISGNSLLQVKPGTDSSARLQFARELLETAYLALHNANKSAEDLPWAISELVEHAVSTADALVRAELGD